MAVECIDWSKDPYAGGAYSYPTPWTKGAVEILKQPIHRHIYLAGEALVGDTMATVEGALASGVEVAQRIMSR